MFRGGEGAGRGPGMDRLGGLVLAMIAGALVPVIAVLTVASRSPVPRDCSTGQATSTTVEGALVYTTGSDLWYSEGYPGHPRKLVDYGPPRARPQAVTSPSTSASPAPSPSTRPSPSPSAGAPVPQVLAADVSSDRKWVAYMVLDPPGHPGWIALMLVSPADPPGTPAVNPWYDERTDRENLRAVSVHVLDSGKVLFFTPEPAPVSAVAPAPPPTAAPASPSPGPSTSPALSPSPAAGVTGSDRVQAVIVSTPPNAAIVAHGPQSFLFSRGRTAWPDARGYRVPTVLPQLDDRVDGPLSRVAGTSREEISTPMVSRHLRQVALGSPGRAGSQAVCGIDAQTVPELFSPDESQLALRRGDQTLLLDLTGTHSIAHLVDARLLAWRS